MRHEVLLLVLPLLQQGVCAQVLHKLHTTVEQITRIHTEKRELDRERVRGGKRSQADSYTCLSMALQRNCSCNNNDNVQQNKMKASRKQAAASLHEINVVENTQTHTPVHTLTRLDTRDRKC